MGTICSDDIRRAWLNICINMFLCTILQRRKVFIKRANLRPYGGYLIEPYDRLLQSLQPLILAMLRISIVRILYKLLPKK